MKMKLDIILNRQKSEDLFTNYLDIFKDFKKKDFKKIKYMNDLLLSNLISRNLKNNQFLESNTVQSIIEI